MTSRGRVRFRRASRAGSTRSVKPFTRIRPKPPPPEDDAISLHSNAKPGPDLYVAVARLYQESGKLADAELQYQAALKEQADYLPALLGYAQLKEQLGQTKEATWLYVRAVKTYPREPSVHNNVGLFYARQGRLDEAIAALAIAVQLAPKNALYRNNIATVLVDQGKLREAFAQLREVHSEAAAYYNMGYLLNKKGQTQAALQHFSLAWRADPSMTPAQRWIDYLQRKTVQARLPRHPAAGGVRIAAESGEPATSSYSNSSNSPRYGAGPTDSAAAPEQVLCRGPRTWRQHAGCRRPCRAIRNPGFWFAGHLLRRA